MTQIMQTRKYTEAVTGYAQKNKKGDNIKTHTAIFIMQQSWKAVVASLLVLPNRITSSYRPLAKRVNKAAS